MIICQGGIPAPPILRFITLLTRIKYSKSLLNSRNYIKIFRKIWPNPHLEKNRFSRFWVALSIGYEFLSNVQFTLKLLLKNCIKLQEMNLQQFPQIVTHIFELFCAALQTSYECYFIPYCVIFMFWGMLKLCADFIIFSAV